LEYEISLFVGQGTLLPNNLTPEIIIIFLIIT
jgi:hypothetical protein